LTSTAGDEQAAGGQALDAKGTVFLVSTDHVELGIGHEQNFGVAVAAKPPAVKSKRRCLNPQKSVTTLDRVFLLKREIAVVLVDVVLLESVW